jgi:DNA polymerase-3 subunit beta
LKDLCKTNIGIIYKDNQVCFSSSNEMVLMRTLDFTFLDFGSVLNQMQACKNKIVVSRENFLKALKRISIISNENKTVWITFKQNSILIDGNNPVYGKGSEQIVADCNIESVIGMNAIFLIEALSVMDSQNVVFSFKDSESAIFVQPEGDNSYKALIMPVDLGE